MKNILFTLAVLVVFLSACGEKGSESGNGNQNDSTGTTAQDTSPSPVPDEPETKSPAERFAGEYLSEPYLKQLEEHGSPFELAEFEFPGFYWVLSLSREALEAEKPRFEAYWIHEGGGGGFIHYSESCDCYTPTEGEEDFSLLKKPYILELEGEDAILLKIEGREPERYRRVKDHSSAIRNVLFTGEYTNKLDGKKVVLNEDGSMEGVDGWGYYEIGYDFVGIIQNDYVWFQKSAEDYKDRAYYHWYHDRNGNLVIHEIDGEFPDETIGKAILELEKVK